MFDKTLDSNWEMSRHITMRDYGTSNFFEKVSRDLRDKLHLSELLQLLADMGVQTVYLYDFSCSYYKGDDMDKKLFGGQ